MDLNAILAELQRRKAQLGQRVSDLFTPAQDSNPNFNISGYPTLEQTPSSDQLKAYAAQVAREYAQRAAEGIVPAPIRAREQAMRTDPSAAAKPFTSQEVQQSVPYITAAAPIAYHGSPHEFTQFDASKIGTGQGAQSYGHGLYFAENPEVAGTYKSAGGKISNEFTVNGVALRPTDIRYGIADDIVNKGLDEARRNAKANGPEFLRAFEEIQGKVSGNKSNMYRVNIPDEHVAKMLDWDKPLSEQAPEVQKTLQGAFSKAQAAFNANPNDPTKAEAVARLRMVLAPDLNLTGQKIYETLHSVEGHGSANASKFLSDLGIPGIKYLDQGSRDWRILSPQQSIHRKWTVGSSSGGADQLFNTEAEARAALAKGGTRNFVVFDPAILKDVSRQ